MKQFTIDEINQVLNGNIIGNLTAVIIGVEQISEAIENQMTFIGEKKYIKLWDQSKASAAIVNDKFSATSIGNGTKIDNLVQIAHNCRIGRSCVMAGQSTLAGSVTLGDGVIMGGRSMVSDHVTIGAGARIGGNAGVISDVAPGKTLLGMPADDHRQTLRLWAAQKQLPALIQRLKKK